MTALHDLPTRQPHFKGHPKSSVITGLSRGHPLVFQSKQKYP